MTRWLVALTAVCLSCLLFGCTAIGDDKATQRDCELAGAWYQEMKPYVYVADVANLAPWAQEDTFVISAEYWPMMKNEALVEIVKGHAFENLSEDIAHVSVKSWYSVNCPK